MKLSEFSVKHPVIISMCLIVLIVFGFFSVSKMPTAFMADVSMPQAIVYAIYPGASAEDVEQDISKVLENAFVTLPHFKKVESQSYNSMSWVTITYADGIEPYDQLEELRNRVREIRDDLPAGLQGEPRAIVGGMSMLPVITFTVSAGNDPSRVSDYIKNDLTPKLTRIDGVSGIGFEGGKELQLNIKLKTDELVSKGISVTQVYQVLNYGNVNLPLGTVTHENRAIQVRYAGGFDSLEDIQNLPVGVADGSTVIRICDVADISLDYPKEEYYVNDGTNPLTIVSITKRSDGDAIKIIKQVKKVIADEERDSGGALKFHIVSDDARQIKASMKTVITSGVAGVIFAVLVILLFMADWRATVTIAIAIPLCILFTFIGLKLFNQDINLMTLTGIVISLGMVVDGSSVMLDQIYRYYRQKNAETGEAIYTVTQSIYKGWDEVAASILASVATTMVCFIPMAIIKGLIGSILNSVSLTIIFAIGSSFLVALIVVPYLLKLLLKEGGPKPRSKPRRFDVAMDKVERWYRKILVWAIENKKTVIVCSIILLFFSGFTALQLGIAFIPSTDAGEFYISVDFPVGTELEQTEAKMQKAQKILYEYVPEVDNAIFYIGRSMNKGISAMSSAECAYAHVILVPVAERKRSVQEIMLQMQEVWSAILPDSKVSISPGGYDRLVGYVTGGGGYGIKLISENMDLLYETASKIKDFLETDPEVITAKLDTNFDTSTMVIDMSQEYLSSLGLTSYQAGITSAILFQGVDAGLYREASSGNRYNIRLLSDITDKDVTVDEIANLHIVTDRGQDVSFANLADIYVENSISQINHTDRAKTITVQATLVSEDAGGVNQRVNEYLSKNPLPNGVDSAAGGIMSLIGDMIPPMMTALLIAVFLVYTVMVIQFEKFRQPLLIMASIPFCFIGVVSGLLMFGSTMNLLALLGLISLSGVVVNNGIILVDYVNQLRKQRRLEIAMAHGTQDKDGEWQIDLTVEEENKLLLECVTDGSASRIKPILITTLTTLLGDIPMAVASGEGSEIYAPMGQAIVGGLITSTLITLVLIPVLYYLTERSRGKPRVNSEYVGQARRLHRGNI